MTVSNLQRAAARLPKYQPWGEGTRPHAPIRTSLIPRFKRWVEVNGFHPYQSWNYHSGFDFMAYENRSGRLVVGLPPSTPVHAIEDGIVLGLSFYLRLPTYDTMLYVAHSQPPGDIRVAKYLHVNPTPGIEVGDFVRRGSVIGTISPAMPNFFKYMYHLHLELFTQWGYWAGPDIGVRSYSHHAHVDPFDVLFPGVRRSYARFVYPRISRCNWPMPPVWPDENVSLKRRKVRI